jgi:sugar phosphate isomerase/epimerase
MKSSITISLVPELKGGPFVYWDGLAAGVSSAAQLGFDAVEIFPPAPEALDVPAVTRLLHDHPLQVAAVGTGAGWALRKLSLTQSSTRAEAEAFIAAMVDKAADLGAPAIVGSMQGRWGEGVSRDDGCAMLRESLGKLGERARKRGTFLLYEPLNRYETNLCNNLSSAVEMLHGTAGVKILADLFHMNIEEVTVHGALRDVGKWVGHVHFADTNRRAIGMGHLDVMPVISALKEIGYDGYLSAEVLAVPSSEAAAMQTIESFRRYVNAR